MSADSNTPAPVTGATTDAGEGESQQDVIDRLAPSCVCPDDLCLGETGDCAVCQQIDPEWDCLRALATPDANDASTGASEGLSEAERRALQAAVRAPQAVAPDMAYVYEAVERIVAARVSAAATRAADDRAERIAQAIASSVSYGFGMNHDGTEDGHAMAYVEGLRDAADIARTTP